VNPPPPLSLFPPVFFPPFLPLPFPNNDDVILEHSGLSFSFFPSSCLSPPFPSLDCVSAGAWGYGVRIAAGSPFFFSLFFFSSPSFFYAYQTLAKTENMENSELRKPVPFFPHLFFPLLKSESREAQTGYVPFFLFFFLPRRTPERRKSFKSDLPLLFLSFLLPTK